MRLILVRHYRTINNQARLIIGWGDAPPADDWEEDLQEVTSRLRAAGIRFGVVWSSELVRARQTARYYADALGCDLVREAPQLNEVDYGELFGCPKEWVAEHIPEYKTDPDFVFPAGESFRQMQRRSVDFVLCLQRVYPAQTVLVVAHAGVIRGLACHFLGLDLAANLKRKVSHRYIGDFLLEKDRCLAYDELGKPSGFVKDGAVQLPWRPPAGGATHAVSADKSVPHEASGCLSAPAVPSL
jgi:broad specificity phosphatase PhoE